MNFSILCLILFVGLTSQGCFAKLKYYDSVEFTSLQIKAVISENLKQFSREAKKITDELLVKVYNETNTMNLKSFRLTERLFPVLYNATVYLNKDFETNTTKIVAATKAKLDQASKSTSSFFNILISSVKDRYIKELIGEAERLDGSLEAKAASLRQSIDQKISEINANLRIAVRNAYESETANYWRQIEETQMAKIISQARRGVKAQVSEFMAQQFKDNLQSYEAQLKRLQQSYVDETRSKIGDLEAKKNLYAQELKDLADSLKLSLQTSRD